ncbi:MAG: T9SS type A sorting domain-containing protein [Paludibacter sp.]
MKQRHLFLTVMLTVNWAFNFAQTPMVKVDLNMEGRAELEVNEPGYTPWALARVHTDSKILSGVTFTLTANGPTSISTFRANWNKANVQSPTYMRLVGDGLRIDNDTMLKYPGKSAIIELKISGLAVGKHTIQTYHNTYEDITKISLAPMNVYLNDILINSNIKRTVLVTKKADATVLMTTLNVTQAGQDMVLKFEADPNFVPESGKTADRNVIINAFELNADDASKQAHTPTPIDKDFHRPTNAGTDTLRWLAAMNGYTKSHSLYIGTDSMSVANATTATADMYKGTFPLNTKEYKLENLYNLNTYYWRVDETDSAGVVTKGNIWSFRPQHLAFPGAEGYGRDAIGGRGGKVVYVTNLNDDGPGSFRDAVTNGSGPRTILFAVSGLITLNSRIMANNPYITVAGQTAPGKGICFRWAPIGVLGNDMIVQNLRLRLGIGVTYDGMGLTGANHSIIDHCSISWTIDEAFSSRGAHNITLQNTLISEALNIAGHDHYADGKAHGFAGSVGGDVGSLHHNLLAHCNGRNWSLAGGLDGNGYYSGRMDVFNMVVYNFGGRTTDGGAREVNFVNNYYKKGPACANNMMLTAQLEGVGKGSQAYYYAGNVFENVNKTFACDGTDNTCARNYQQAATQILDWQLWVDKPFFPSYGTIIPAKDAFKQVLSDVGCTQPTLDDHDKRIIDETLNGTYSCKGSRSGISGLPDHEGDVGGWEVYPGFTRATNWDIDLDGLPDWWETTIGTSPNSASGSFDDANADNDKNGYTNLEEYLHWMTNPHYFVKTGSSVDIDLKQYAVGYTKSPVFTISGVVNSSVSLNGSVAHITTSKEGLASFTFDVTDSEGSKKTQKIGVFVGDTPADSPFSYTYYKDRALTQLVSVSPTAIRNIESNNLSDIVLYPNPVRNKLNVAFDSQISTTANFTIYNIAGDVVLKEKKQIEVRKNQLSFDSHKLTPGIYTLKVGNSSIFNVLKFVVCK